MFLEDVRLQPGPEACNIGRGTLFACNISVCSCGMRKRLDLLVGDHGIAHDRLDGVHQVGGGAERHASAKQQRQKNILKANLMRQIHLDTRRRGLTGQAWLRTAEFPAHFGARLYFDRRF